MIIIKLFKTKQYYRNKWGDKEYLDGSKGDITFIEAAILTNSTLNSEAECFYEAYGETKEEAEKQIENYLIANPNHPVISSKEYRTQ